MAIDWTKVIITADDDTVAMAAGQVLLLASGVPGESASVEVVETVTLDPLEDADVENVGDSRNVRLKFKIPRGQSGVWGGIGGTLEDQADLKQALDAKADIIHTSASGSLVHITDGAAYPVDSLSVIIDPVQDLHGYDAPWPAGGGKNLLGITIADLKSWNTGGTWTGDKYTSSSVEFTFTTQDGYVTSIIANGQASGNAYFRLTSTAVHDDFVGKVLNGCPSGGGGASYLMTGYNDTDSVAFTVYDTGSGMTIPSVTGKSFRLYIVISSGYNASNVVFRPMIRASSKSATYAPYSNVCPISGHSSATVTRTGVNIWDEEWEEGGISSDSGDNSPNTVQIRTKNYIPVVPNMQIYANFNMGSGSDNLLTRWYDRNKNYIGYNPVIFANVITTVPSNAYYLRFCTQTSYGTTYNSDISINYPSSNHDYHTGHVQTVTIALGSTVYGAQLDAVAGTLTVTHKGQRLLSTMPWTGNNGWNPYCYYTKVNDIKLVSGYGSVAELICSHLKKDTPGNLALTSGYHIGVGQGDGNSIFVNFGQFATADDLKAFLVDNEVYVVYPLASPVTVTLTPAQISLLLGENNVFADTGDTSIGYRASTKLYIDSKLASAVAELQALILENS